MKKGLPERQHDGAAWAFRDVLPGWMLRNLCLYERRCVKFRRRMQFLVNLCQRVSFMVTLSTCAPCLLTATSAIWDMKHDRLSVPTEHTCGGTS